MNSLKYREIRGDISLTVSDIEDNRERRISKCRSQHVNGKTLCLALRSKRGT
jgi:hypothetical protein